MTIYAIYDILNYEETQEKITPGEYLNASSYENEKHMYYNSRFGRGQELIIIQLYYTLCYFNEDAEYINASWYNAVSNYNGRFVI